MTYDRTHYRSLSKRLYTQTVDVVISENDFYRYGWELTRTDTVAFNREIEEQAKFLMRNVVAIYENLMQHKDAILRFQNQFGFHEDVWTYEAIKKDYFRHCSANRVNILSDLLEKVDVFILANLSKLTDYQNLNIFEYENPDQTTADSWDRQSMGHTASIRSNINGQRFGAQRILG